MTDDYFDIDFKQKHPTVKGYWVQAEKYSEMCRKANALEQIRNEVQRMADSKILNMKIVLELIDKYTKGDTDV